MSVSVSVFSFYGYNIITKRQPIKELYSIYTGRSYSYITVLQNYSTNSYAGVFQNTPNRLENPDRNAWVFNLS